jgi:hypothetical protein
VLLPPRSSGTRFIHVHRNEPGGLGRLNEFFAQRRINIAAQYCQTDTEIGYVVLDVEGGVQDAPRLLADIRAIPGTISARLCLSRSSSRTFLISTLASAVWLRPRSVPVGAPGFAGVSEGKVTPPRDFATALKQAAQRGRKGFEPAAAKVAASGSKPRSGD